MANIAKLCSTCTDIVHLKDGQNPSIPTKDNNTFRDHHTTLESLRDAVRQDCFICTKAWSFFGKECHAYWSNNPKSWSPLTYKLNRLETIVLSIRWSSPYFAYTTPAKFHLRPVPEVTPETSENSLSSPKERTSTSSALSLGQAYQWYMSCRSLHTQCNRLIRSPRWCPTRLLDIGLNDEPNWKLQLSSVDICTPPPYMTLSYTWGPSPFIKLTTANIEEYRRGSPIRGLPRTFQDTITVARRFSIRYVWIDALCILQDSKEDWEREASSMRDVYMNSSCNIAAAVSVDPYDGLFHPRHASDIQYGLIWSDTIGLTGKFYHILDENYWNRQVSDTVLHQRGWAVQERLLAPRSLQFTQHQIFWECFEDQKCEAFPRGLPSFLYVKNTKPIFATEISGSRSPRSITSTITMWNDIIKVYSRCSLTMPDDKLVALSGLAKLFRHAMGDVYIAGLWKHCILECLTWHIVRPKKRAFSQYRAPSWSWAATDGAVEFNHWLTFSRTRVVDVLIDRSTLDPTGKVHGGFIAIEAVVVPAVYTREDSLYSYGRLKIGDHDIGSVIAYEDNLGEGFGNETALYCLALGHRRLTYTLQTSVEPRVHLEGMFLRPALDTPGCYTRVGYFEFADEDAMKEFGISVDPETRGITQDEKISPSQIRIF